MDRDTTSPPTGQSAKNATKAAKPTSKAATRVTPDWEQIELDYRAGVKTLRQIGEAHGITHAAISKRAKRDGWERDLSAKIKQKADALVSKSEVSKEVTRARKIAEREVIEANALAISEVLLRHRQDIHRNNSLVVTMMQELELQSGPDNVENMKALGELLRSEDDKGVDRLNDIYQKIISLPERAKTMKLLSDALRIGVDLQRQAYGLDNKPGMNTPGMPQPEQRIQVEFVQPPHRPDDPAEDGE